MIVSRNFHWEFNKYSIYNANWSTRRFTAFLHCNVSMRVLSNFGKTKKKKTDENVNLQTYITLYNTIQYNKHTQNAQTDHHCRFRCCHCVCQIFILLIELINFSYVTPNKICIKWYYVWVCVWLFLFFCCTNRVKSNDLFTAFFLLMPDS